MNFSITQVIIKRIPENKGHVWFVSMIVDDVLKLDNIAIFKRLNKDGYRLVFPEKKYWDKKIKIFFPLTLDAYSVMEKAVNDKL